jgi:hypothetical protein
MTDGTPSRLSPYTLCALRFSALAPYITLLRDAGSLDSRKISDSRVDLYYTFRVSPLKVEYRRFYLNWTLNLLNPAELAMGYYYYLHFPVMGFFRQRLFFIGQLLY